MNNLYFISSAVGADYGVFSYQERFAQLLESIASVRKQDPNGIIHLYDITEKPLPDEDEKTLISLVEKYVPMHSHKLTPDLDLFDKTDTNLTGKKTFGEMVNTLEFLNWLVNEPAGKYKRVFKLSGRYKLNDKFNQVNWDSYSKKIVFKQQKNWHGDPVYTLRLWSFDSLDAYKVRNLFLTMWSFIIENIVTSNQVRIIEFVICKFAHEMKFPIQELEWIGVEGPHGQDGVYCDD